MYTETWLKCCPVQSIPVRIKTAAQTPTGTDPHRGSLEGKMSDAHPQFPEKCSICQAPLENPKLAVPLSIWYCARRDIERLEDTLPQAHSGCINDPTLLGHGSQLTWALAEIAALQQQVSQLQQRLR